MLVTDLKVNHLKNPLGFQMETPRVSWVVRDTESTHATGVRVEVAETETFQSLLFDSGIRKDADNLSFPLDFTLLPGNVITGA